MDIADVLVKLGRWTAEQWGLVTSAQASQDGIDAVQLTRLTQASLLTAVGDGVYQLAGTPVPAHLEIKTAWLRLDSGTPAWRRLTPGVHAGAISHS
ncbi:type IV toxin-antitoxin system AbiEi family antitoxin domain-containing protein [Streptomyces sp. 7N604]|uniref:type IV toxin-antitoxin system AbiEi family antitoxin domain-containing protein n=1 Tax=Streptomyces sp. 7N604 TaxID=3457415 RepID=UPI003FD3CB81